MLAKWDGETFSSLGMNAGGSVLSLAVWDDGGGPALYVGGSFSSAGGVVSKGIARWDGTWSGLGTGIDTFFVDALAVHDDGGGPALYAGGVFTEVDGVSARNIARFRDGQWSALGDGVNDAVYALESWDDGSGSALYVGGSFGQAGASIIPRLARWRAGVWEAPGGGLSSSTAVTALEVHDDGDGSALYVGGRFEQAGGAAAQNIARWDGTDWSAIGSGLDRAVGTLTTIPAGVGVALFAGGDFTSSGNDALILQRAATWDGKQWSRLESDNGFGLSDEVLALEVYDDGGGPALYAAGRFRYAGDRYKGRVAKWDGQEWSSLGFGVSSQSPLAVISALAVYDGGTGPELYAGGFFGTIDGVNGQGLARWNGNEWAEVGVAIGSGARVHAFVVHDDGSGPRLFAGGDFFVSGGVERNLAAWDGEQWTAVGGGTNFAVFALATYDDGSGPALYASGDFTEAGDEPVNRIAKWDGAQWTPLGSGFDAPAKALRVFEAGDGPKLYAGGEFTTAGGVAAAGIASWDGLAWSTVGAAGADDSVSALEAYDDGTGLALYAGGEFEQIGGIEAKRLARWDGVAWSRLEAGDLDTVYASSVSALKAMDHGEGTTLYAAGRLHLLGHVASRNIGQLVCPGVQVFLDGFESGDTDRWSLTFPDE